MVGWRALAGRYAFHNKYNAFVDGMLMLDILATMSWQGRRSVAAGPPYSRRVGLELAQREVGQGNVLCREQELQVE